jgi:AmiR/NasT family two-component response regulator
MRKQAAQPHRTNRRALLAHHDFELRALFRHALQRASYDVVSCTRPDDLSAFLATACELDLFVCDAEWLVGSLLENIANRQHRREFPPLVLIDRCDDFDIEQRINLQPAAVTQEPQRIMRYVAQLLALAASQSNHLHIGQSSVAAPTLIFLRRANSLVAIADAEGP